MDISSEINIFSVIKPSSKKEVSLKNIKAQRHLS